LRPPALDAGRDAVDVAASRRLALEVVGMLYLAGAALECWFLRLIGMLGVEVRPEAMLLEMTGAAFEVDVGGTITQFFASSSFIRGFETCLLLLGRRGVVSGVAWSI
jgi:hypothetical protein